MVKFGWRLELSFEVGLARGSVEEVHPTLYRVWEESGRIKIRIRDKI
jgi:hypothetical protein